MRLPSIYLINLDRSTDRLERFSKLNGHLGAVARFSAFDGDLLDRIALEASGHIAPDLTYGAGTLGCALSHISLWEQADFQDRPITVCEDDIIVNRHFVESASAALATLPSDWDIVHWGCSLNPNRLSVWLDLGAGIGGVRIDSCGWPARDEEALRAFQERRLPTAPLRLAASFGMLCYSISPKGARAALAHCLPLRKRDISFENGKFHRPDNGIDATLCGLYPSINAYIALPQLALPLPGGVSVRRSIDDAGPGS